MASPPVTRQSVVQTARELGAANAVPVRVAGIQYYPELRKLCEMNACGKYGGNWACPPACGGVEQLSAELSSYENGVVYQYVGQLEDSFDFAGMMAAGGRFGEITRGLKAALPAGVLVLGGGCCNLCEPCSYPDAPCAHPGQLAIPVEAFGVNVSELCALAGVPYIHGPGTVTYTGLVAF